MNNDFVTALRVRQHGADLLDRAERDRLARVVRRARSGRAPVIVATRRHLRWGAWRRQPEVVAGCAPMGLGLASGEAHR